MAGGDLTLKVAGPNAEDYAEATITIKPKIVITTGEPGTYAYLPTPDTITVNGSGFPAGDYLLKFDGELGTTIAGFTVESDGSFTVSATTPEAPKGNHLIDLVLESDPTTSVFYDYVPAAGPMHRINVVPSVGISPDKATVGQTVTVEAAGLRRARPTTYGTTPRRMPLLALPVPPCYRARALPRMRRVRSPMSSRYLLDRVTIPPTLRTGAYS